MRILFTPEQAKNFKIFLDQDVQDAISELSDLLIARESLILDYLEASVEDLRAFQGKRSLLLALKNLQNEVKEALNGNYPV